MTNILANHKNPKRFLGVVGGMGMQATDYFCRLITNMQSVQTEQEYLDMLVYYKPSIPDRTAYIADKNYENPLYSLKQAVQTLENAGATCLVMPCVTAHYFYKELMESTSIPFFNIIKETADLTASKGYGRVGLLATPGTINAGLFTKIFSDTGVSIVIPNEDDQAALMEIIYRVKLGEEISSTELDDYTKKLRSKGAEAVILGCTELSLLSDGSDKYIDTMEVLARAALRELGVRRHISDEYT